jgi:hypothetical protein
MIGQRVQRIFVCLASALILIACALPLIGSPTQVPQPLSPQLLGTPVAQTAVAAKTETAINLPPSLTPTLTPFPTGTLIEAPTLPTFIFALATFTPLPTLTFTPGASVQGPAGGNGSSGGGNANGGSPFTGKEWTCVLAEKEPKNGSVLEPGKDFYAYFTILNTGTKTWPSNGVDFMYTGGYRHNDGKIYDLPASVAPGNKITVKVLFTAPKNAGSYNSYWTLMVGKLKFCSMRIGFEIK